MQISNRDGIESIADPRQPAEGSGRTVESEEDTLDLDSDAVPTGDEDEDTEPDVDETDDGTTDDPE